MLVPGAVWVGCAFGVLDAVVEGTTGYALRTTLLMSAIAFGAWWVLASPCLEVSPHGLRVVNPLRVHEIPFAPWTRSTVRGLTTVIGPRGVRTTSGRSPRGTRPVPRGGTTRPR